ncbi:hypothetical protein CVT24_011609 [Panaeolus cyanescens]|uniref:DUF1275 domain protein n=1 Tax=Panaeolus cyanescens TaxID=181874 RepID=A0A409YGX4_9AGAR|nr:hypothetical protein CVT24_011609 [Panaeolus cyanescens]
MSQNEKAMADASQTTSRDRSESTSTNPKDIERVQPKQNTSLLHYLNSDVNPAETTWPMAAYCFMTGYMQVLALALARLFEGAPGFRDQTFHKADQQALCSLLSFQFGAFLGRIGDRVGAQKRSWLIAGTFLQGLLGMAAAIAFWKSGQPSLSGERELPAWTNALTFVGLAFMSASLGLQGIQAKRLNTQFGTTIVLTTVWVELVTDPGLFKLRKRVMTRDHRFIAAGALFLGAFVGRAILAKVGTAGTMGISVGFRVIIALSWMFVPGKPPRA